MFPFNKIWRFIKPVVLPLARRGADELMEKAERKARRLARKAERKAKRKVKKIANLAHTKVDDFLDGKK